MAVTMAASVPPTPTSPLRTSWATLIFAVLFAAFLIGPPELGRAQFPPNPDMKWQDLIDLATPVVLLPAYWLVVRQPQSAPPLRRWELLTFLALGALWVEAQGMHLAANSIDNVIHEDASVPGGTLTYFYDEVLSHFLWHAATIGLMLLVLVRQWWHPIPEAGSLPVAAGLGAAIYGIAFFMVVVEGGTGALGVPAALLLALVSALRLRSRTPRSEPATVFVGLAHALAFVLFAVWWIYWGFRLPQFTEVGLF